MNTKPTHVRQIMLDNGLNCFGADLLCESFLKSQLAPAVETSGKPLAIQLPIHRKDCAGYAGVEITLWPVSTVQLPQAYGSPAVLKKYLRLAQDLVARAERDGVVLTIERRPLQPLAMGNAETVIEVRELRPSATTKGATP